VLGVMRRRQIFPESPNPCCAQKSKQTLSRNLVAFPNARARRTLGSQKTPHGLVGVVRAASESLWGLEARRARREPRTRFGRVRRRGQRGTTDSRIWLVVAWVALEGRGSALPGKARTGTIPRCLS
jgi:hypothetical protein